MAHSYLFLPSFTLSSSPAFPSKPLTLSFTVKNSSLSLFSGRHLSRAIGKDGKFYPTSSDSDPPEAPEDSEHGISKFELIKRQAGRAKKVQEEEYKKDQNLFLAAIAGEEDAPDDEGLLVEDGEADDLFGEIDKAISMKRREFVKQGLLKPNPKKDPRKAQAAVEEVEVEEEELEAEEAVDLEEINKLEGLRNEDEEEESSELDDDEVSRFDDSKFSSYDSSFDIDLDSFTGNANGAARIVDPKFRMSLAELLD